MRYRCFSRIGADLISNRLDSFRSVLSIPGDQDQPVRILHLSFRDFLVQSRPSDQVSTTRITTLLSLLDTPSQTKSGFIFRDRRRATIPPEAFSALGGSNEPAGSRIGGGGYA